MKFLKRRRVVVLLAMSAWMLTGCSDDDVSSTPDLNMNGTWSFSASINSPPRAVACTGTLSSMSGQSLCDAFEVDIAQTESSIGGSSTSTFCGLDFQVTGSVDGSSVNGQFIEDSGTDVFTVPFTGQGSAGTLTVDVESFSTPGGFCTTTGTYTATLR